LQEEGSRQKRELFSFVHVFSCAYLGDYLLYLLELNLAPASLDGHLFALQGSFLKDERAA